MLILVIVGGFWKLNRTLTKIEITLSGKVGHEECSDRQERCPCHKEIEGLRKEMEGLHPRKKEPRR
jgi:hypothetical protein